MENTVYVENKDQVKTREWRLFDTDQGVLIQCRIKTGTGDYLQWHTVIVAEGNDLFAAEIDNSELELTVNIHGKVIIDNCAT